MAAIKASPLPITVEAPRQDGAPPISSLLLRFGVGHYYGGKALNLEITLTLQFTISNIFYTVKINLVFF